ncbi:hypothetical protein H112_00316 [Trichophyton rubrum D6]|uniref:Uncharacterized protein n=1 Tax=Trichophyton soudanense CBS 452.61 TaxID=1215331 RepID=A0A022Y7L5_TRISD|nr:hypothetical protein H100_00317 [Trichophyton rubrum MR850]EZF46737.1 hypothetical protein H102_00316 [Trichophyton rubrum CBS 100081]EZF67965.1 hypothetical protein H104_00315 [Trichophyton rubrum CBS 289.86]EZF78588.1 hypothetical protein H105_00311 [Trichophyton soudanense CBS 452.61]EZF89213.1 hypothetical protein H110_00319 [Trichophyton rubrum MR1448]KDB38415.1 hypothetical protein H112_00316 [Trichophyton rubrum D6]KMQ46149.1 hypothetical protein HL42_3236 [Trichophyton rubrum]
MQDAGSRLEAVVELKLAMVDREVVDVEDVEAGGGTRFFVTQTRRKYFSFFSSSPPAHKAYMEFSFDITAQPTAEVLPTIRHQNTSFLEHSPLRKCHTRTISQINTSNKGHLYQQ